MPALKVNDTIALDDRLIDERFVRAAGPGGRHVPRKPTAVELRFDVGASALPYDVKRRLFVLTPKLMTSGGVLVVVSRVHRSQEQNRKAARARFVALLRRAARATRKRRPTRPRKVVRQERAVAKMRHSAVKRSRRRVDRSESATT